MYNVRLPYETRPLMHIYLRFIKTSLNSSKTFKHHRLAGRLRVLLYTRRFHLYRPLLTPIVLSAPPPQALGSVLSTPLVEVSITLSPALGSPLPILILLLALP